MRISGGIRRAASSAQIDAFASSRIASRIAAALSGEAVFASDEEQGSDLVQVTEVVEGDLTEVTYDVIGLADDSIRGVRLHIFAEETSDGFTLRTVEMTLLCGRGVSGGFCV